jgi:hypothetical protein
MAELPGWDRARLDTAPEPDVAAARLIVFAREVKPLLQRDFAAEIDELKERSPREQEIHDKRMRAKARDQLVIGWRGQTALRKLLLLEPTDGR